MPVTVIDYLSSNVTDVAKNTSKLLTGSKKVASKLIVVPKYTLRTFKKLYKFFKGNSTDIIVENPDYVDYCTALAGGIVNDMSNVEQSKFRKLVRLFKNILPFDPTLTFSSKMTSEYLQIDAISTLMCKYYKNEIPYGSDRIDILCIAGKIAYRICRSNPKAAIAIRCAIITLQVGSLTSLTPSSLLVLLSAVRQLLEFENGLTFVTKLFED